MADGGAITERVRWTQREGGGETEGKGGRTEMRRQEMAETETETERKTRKQSQAEGELGGRHSSDIEPQEDPLDTTTLRGTWDG